MRYVQCMMCIPTMCIKMYTNITNHQIIWLIYLPNVAPKIGALVLEHPCTISVLAAIPYDSWISPRKVGNRHESDKNQKESYSPYLHQTKRMSI